MMLGLAMSGDDLAGLIVASVVMIYLVFALVFPEKL